MKSKILLSVYVVALMVIFSGCSKEPGYVIKDFYEAKTWEEKKAFILDPEGLKASDTYDEEAEYNVKEILFEKKIDENTSIYKLTRMKTLAGKEEKQVRQFLVTKVGDKEKIDFKTMMAINKIGLLQYCQSGLTGPTKFWVKVNFEASDFSFIAYKTDIDCLVIDDGKRIYIPLENKEFPADIAKLKEISIQNRDALVLIEVSQKAEINWIDQYYIRPENVKFVKLHPFNGD